MFCNVILNVSIPETPWSEFNYFLNTMTWIKLIQMTILPSYTDDNGYLIYIFGAMIISSIFHNYIFIADWIGNQYHIYKVLHNKLIWLSIHCLCNYIILLFTIIHFFLLSLLFSVHNHFLLRFDIYRLSSNLCTLCFFDAHIIISSWGHNIFPTILARLKERSSPNPLYHFITWCSRADI